MIDESSADWQAGYEVGLAHAKACPPPVSVVEELRLRVAELENALRVDCCVYCSSSVAGSGGTDGRR